MVLANEKGRQQRDRDKKGVQEIRLRVEGIGIGKR